MDPANRAELNALDEEIAALTSALEEKNEIIAKRKQLNTQN